MGREISFLEAEDSGGSHVEKSTLEHDGGVKDWRDEDGSIVDNGGERIVREDSESKAWSIMRDLDPWTAWLYKPHTVTVLIIGACLLVYIFCPFPMLMDEISGCFLGFHCHFDSCNNLVVVHIYLHEVFFFLFLALL